MKRSGLIAVVLLLAASVAGFFLGSATWDSAPRSAPSKAGFVGFEPGELDLGPQPWGQTVDFELQFVNRGESDIQIETARSSCDCTVIDEEEIKGRTLAVGATLAISGRMRTQMEPGAKLRTITITDASGNPYSVSVTVDVRGTWTLSDSTIDFGEIYLDAPPSREDVPTRFFTFQSDVDQLLDVPPTDAPWLSQRIAERDGGRTDILLQVHPEKLAPGVNTAVVTVHTSNSIKPTGRVYVKANGVQQFRVDPAQVILVGTKSTTISISTRDGEWFAISSVTSSHDSVTAAVMSDGRIAITNPSGKQIRERVLIEFETSDGQVGRILVSAF